LTDVKVNSINRTIKGTKSLNRAIKGARSVNRGVKSPASVNREINTSSGMNKEVNDLSGVSREICSPVSVQGEVICASSVAKDVNGKNTVTTEAKGTNSINHADGMDAGVNSVQEYLARIDEVLKGICKMNKEKGYPKYSNKLWYRGLKSAKYDLVPRIARNGLNTDYEILYLSRFKSKAITYLEQLPAYPHLNWSSSYWGWLFWMQHYGVPTRIMDWTRDALAALVFATTGKSEEEKNEDSAVWCLDPLRLNRTFTFYDFYQRGYIPNVEEPVVHKFFGPDAKIENKKPCAVTGPMNSPRIIAQKVTFTVFPHIKNIIPLNEFPDSSDYLWKITVTKDRCGYIAEQLRSYGFTEPVLFPEMSQIAREISAEGF